MKNILTLLLLSLGGISYGQGPPITGDKAIMLAPGNMLVKTLTELRYTESESITYVPLMFHYLPSTNTLVGIHVPYVNGINNSQGASGSSGLGDVQLLAKYQFYRKDQMGKTFRVAAKTLQALPTGKKLGAAGISTGNYSSYLGVIAGLETLKYGVTNELGYVLSPSDDNDELRYKLGFGLPLKKSTYPVDQINLYFEYQSSWFTSTNQYLLMYSQGIQYAKDQTTLEIAIQFPLTQTISGLQKRRHSIFIGSRYVF